jgi:hypothetical protein
VPTNGQRNVTSTDLVVLLVQTAATWYMVGFIWTMQLLHYPLFDRVGREAFAAYETEHNRRFGLLVGPGIALVAITSIIQLLTRPPSTPLWAAIGAVVLLLVIIVSTALYQAPQHARLSSGFDPGAYQTLVRSNWVRTIAWSLLGLLDLWLVWQGVPRS